MQFLFLIIFFVFGLFFGSFFTVVGLRLPLKKKIVNDRSHCDACNHELSFLDMIPIVSFICLKGRCRYCREKIDPLSTWMELFTGILFALSYGVFGFSYELIIALGIVSMLVIISVSDMTYMVIPDEVLVFFAGYFLIFICLRYELLEALCHIVYGLFLFGVMYVIMLLGNFLFHKESLGGGDIKMMFVIGTVLQPLLGLISIFLGSFLALPISFLLIKKRKQTLIPFGPFLLISFAFIYFTGINTSMIVEFIRLL